MEFAIRNEEHLSTGLCFARFRWVVLFLQDSGEEPFLVNSSLSKMENLIIPASATQAYPAPAGLEQVGLFARWAGFTTCQLGSMALFPEVLSTHTSH